MSPLPLFSGNGPAVIPVIKTDGLEIGTFHRHCAAIDRIFLVNQSGYCTDDNSSYILKPELLRDNPPPLPPFSGNKLAVIRVFKTDKLEIRYIP